jgi:hypothetical protein
MKKTVTIVLAIAIIGLASITGILFGKSNSGSQAASDDYAILTYMPYSGTPYTFNGDRYSIRVYYGQKQVEYIKLTKEELDEKALLTAVAKLLGRLSGEGYTLISTNVISISSSTSSEIHCFLKKVK